MKKRCSTKNVAFSVHRRAALQKRMVLKTHGSSYIKIKVKPVLSITFMNKTIERKKSLTMQDPQKIPMILFRYTFEVNEDLWLSAFNGYVETQMAQ